MIGDPGSDITGSLTATVHMSELGADPQRLERAVMGVRRDLRALEVSEAIWASRESPDGARSGAAAIIGELVVTMTASVALFYQVMAALTDWRRSRPGRRVEIDVNGSKLVLDDLPDSERERIVEAYLRSTFPHDEVGGK